MYDEGYDQYLYECDCDDEAAYQAQCDGEVEVLAQQEADAAEADQPELKQCPFCGSDDVHITHDRTDAELRIECMQCYFRSEWLYDREMLITMWNRRV